MENEGIHQLLRERLQDRPISTKQDEELFMKFAVKQLTVVLSVNRSTTRSIFSSWENLARMTCIPTSFNLLGFALVLARTWG